MATPEHLADIVVVGDIRGNIVALEAVFEDMTEGDLSPVRRRAATPRLEHGCAGDVIQPAVLITKPGSTGPALGQRRPQRSRHATLDWETDCN